MKFNRLFFAAAPVLVTCMAWANPFFAMDTAVRSLDELDRVRALGYDGIAWMTGSFADMTAVSARVQQRGLKLFAVFCYHYAVLSRTGLVLDPHLDGTMEALKGTDAVVWLPISSDDFRASSSDGDSIAVPALQKLADRAAGYGLRIAVYPHTGCWTERVQDAVRLAKKVGRKNFGVTFNLCHCLMVGDESKIPDLLREALPYLFAVTVNGADSGAGRTTWDRLIRPLDEGSYDLHRVLSRLEELRYAGPIGLQAYGVKTPVEENLARSMTAWRRLNKRN